MVYITFVHKHISYKINNQAAKPRYPANIPSTPIFTPALFELVAAAPELVEVELEPEVVLAFPLPPEVCVASVACPTKSPCTKLNASKCSPTPVVPFPP